LYSVSYRVQAAILIAILAVFIVVVTLTTNADAHRLTQVIGTGTDQAENAAIQSSDERLPEDAFPDAY